MLTFLRVESCHCADVQAAMGVKWPLRQRTTAGGSHSLGLTAKAANLRNKSSPDIKDDGAATEHMPLLTPKDGAATPGEIKRWLAKLLVSQLATCSWMS